MFYKTRKKRNKKIGFTIIEFLIAVFVMVTGILGVYALIPHSIKSSYINTDKYIATQLAREGIEIIRNIRDTNWIEEMDSPLAVWNEGLLNCALGCEVDYTMPLSKDPILTPYGVGRFLKIDNNGFYNYVNGKETKFKRKITISQVNYHGEIGLRTISQVSWSRDYPDIILEETFYNWR